MNNIRKSTTKESPLQASKWLSVQAMIEVEEMQDLFKTLDNFYLARCGIVCTENEGLLSTEQFLHDYATYIHTLKNGTLPDALKFRSLFSPALTVSLDSLYSVPLEGGKHVLRVAKPVIQLQANYIDYSPDDQKFRPMIFGMDSIPWGIQFSYPQLYQDNLTKQVEQVKKTSAFPNTQIFHTLQKWMRQNTIPTPFEVNGTTSNAPIRIGKKCLPWINKHPQLIKKGIHVNHGTVQP